MTLRIEGVTVRYGPVVALDGVGLEVRAGQLVAVLGPSGSGKSTLLRAVAGLEPLTAGRICWDGTDLAGVPPHRRGFGLMFQEHLLFPHTDVHGNVAFGLRVRRVPPADVDRRVRDLLALVGLAGFGHRSVASLSGGEAQRVALARALAPGPRLLMLDEPLGSLDRPRREQLVDELGRLLRDAGITGLFVTHDQNEAFALADRVVVLAAGRVVEDGPAARVWARPRSAAAARFLGFVNETAGICADGAATHRTAGDEVVPVGTTVASAWGTFPAPPGTPPGPVRLFARPDALRLQRHPIPHPGRHPAPPGPDAAPARLRATVTGRTFRHDRFLARLSGPDGPLLVACEPAGLPRVGADVTVSVDPDRVVVVTEPPGGDGTSR